VGPARPSLSPAHRATDITVKVKPNMPFRKIFEAAEVRAVA
jgi:hypothetical protein